MRIKEFEETLLSRKTKWKPVMVILHHAHVKWMICRDASSVIVYDRHGFCYRLDNYCWTDEGNVQVKYILADGVEIGVAVDGHKAERVKTEDLFAS